MGEAEFEQAERAFRRVVEGLFSRGATGRSVFGLELSEELIAATLESGAREQDEAEFSDVQIRFFEDSAVFSARVKVHGKAWPPRPPVDTRIEFGARDITHSDAGKSGSVMFRVENPLTFSSKFADVVIALLGKLTKRLPISIDALRHKDSLVTLDFAEIVRMTRPDLAEQAAHARLYHLKVSLGKVRVDVGFTK
ncbi:MAG: hypothetical protein K8I27_00295 [Planctomycetes bacterium]|nr:hypothetical protein [Planctomycetota bacterium]